MEVGTAFVSGANRGIGFEMVKQLANLPKPPEFIFATYRDKNTKKNLEGVKNESKQCEIVLIQMDVTKSNDIEDAGKVVKDTLKDKGLNLLINNAGVYKEEKISEITEENLLYHFKTNAMGPILLFQELLPCLEKAADAQKGETMFVSRAAVINITSKFASLTNMTDDQDWLNSIPYRISKTALNMSMRILSMIVKDRGILVVGIHPGWVKTEMGREEAPEEASDAIAQLFERMSQLNETHHGTFIEKNGTPIPF